MQATQDTQDTQLTPAVAGTPGSVGEGFSLVQFHRSAYAGNAMSPLVLVDDFRMWAPTFPLHPHAGMSAVTLVFEDTVGSMRSQDSIGHNMAFGAGDLHWTLAGRGITHTQVPTQAGDRIHALQIFVNLPARLKGLAPDSFHVRAADMPVVATASSRIRVVAGEHQGLRSPAPLPQPVTMLDATLQAGAKLADLQFAQHWNAWIYALEGALQIDGRTVPQGHAMCAMGTADGLHVAIEAPHAPAHFVVLAGERIDEPVFQQGPFVMESQAALARVIADYRAGRFAPPPPR